MRGLPIGNHDLDRHIFTWQQRELLGLRRRGRGPERNDLPCGISPERKNIDVHHLLRQKLCGSGHLCLLPVKERRGCIGSQPAMRSDDFHRFGFRVLGCELGERVA